MAWIAEFGNPILLCSAVLLFLFVFIVVFICVFDMHHRGTLDLRGGNRRIQIDKGMAAGASGSSFPDCAHDGRNILAGSGRFATRANTTFDGPCVDVASGNVDAGLAGTAVAMDDDSHAIRRTTLRTYHGAGTCHQHGPRGQKATVDSQRM
jgi:hypothetical protein